MRSNSASDDSMSAPTLSSDWIGNSSRVCSVVNATTVPIDSELPTKLWPARK